MATNNSINNTSNPLSSTALNIDAGAATDSAIQFSINGTGEFICGTDSTDSDSLALSQGSVLGTNNTMHMDSNGIVNFPLQPGFGATVGFANSVTGDGTIYSLGESLAMTESFDVGGDFDPGDGAGTPASFEAPITGLYLLSAADIVYSNPGSGGTTFTVSIVTSNRTYVILNLPTREKVTNFFGINGFIYISGGILADMDISDTVTWQLASSGGSKVDNQGGANISGSLLF
jgi:hypothetical protein